MKLEEREPVTYGGFTHIVHNENTETHHRIIYRDRILDIPYHPNRSGYKRARLLKEVAEGASFETAFKQHYTQKIDDLRDNTSETYGFVEEVCRHITSEEQEDLGELLEEQFLGINPDNKEVKRTY